jgi:hypothetical protein
MKKPLVYLTLVFIATRLAIDAKIPFRCDTINTYMQYLDPRILRNNLAQGIWYLHTQPPLYNLSLGLVLKFQSKHLQTASFSSAYFLMGLLIIVASFALMRKLAVSSRLAWVACLCLMLFPSSIRAERWLFYPYPLEAMTVLAALLLCHFETRRKYTFFVLFELTLAAAVLSRSLYHLIFWMLPLSVLTLVWIYVRVPREIKRYTVTALVFFLIASSVYVKNYAQYGIFSSSTWQGMNLMQMTRYIPYSVKREMVEKGQITPLALIQNFSAPPLYFEYFKLKPAIGNPIIDDLTKSTGAPNFNNYIYARMGPELQHNAIVLITHHPLDYLKAVVNEAYIFFSLKPYRFLDQWRTWLIPRTDSMTHFAFDMALAFGAPLLMLSLFSLALYAVLEPLFRRGLGLRRVFENEDNLPLLVFFIAFNLVYVCAVSNLLELGEACFFRIPIDPLLFIGAALALQSWLRKRELKSPSG